MTRVRLVLLVLLAASIVTVMGLTARGARAADAGGCALPGYVPAGANQPCSADGSEFLGPVGGLIGSFSIGTVNFFLRALDSAALTSAAAALRLTGSLVASTTRPQVLSTWFSAAYWRVASVSVLLTLPFLCAAAIHALVRSDLALVGRAAFGYLPLALLGVSIAAPVTMLLLGATDEMSTFVAAAAGHGDSSILARAAAALRGPSIVRGDLLVGLVVGFLTVLATVGLWIELLIRAAAVDVVVLMLPMFFAAMVWPARRVWAIRAVETLIALILSKFAIVAVLTLGGAALSRVGNGPGALLTGVTLVLLAALSPWALLRMLPLHEVASAAAGGLSRTPRALAGQAAESLMPDRRRSAPRDGEIATREQTEATQDDGRAAALRRLASVDASPRHRGGAETGLDVLDPDTRSGLEAVTHPDRRPSAAGAATAAAVAVVAGASADGPDGRPPIEAPFGDVEWKDFVIADEGDERMTPPVFDDPPAAADEPEPPAPLQPSPSPSSDSDPLRPPEERR